MREKILNTIGFSLLAICFVVSLGRVFSRTKSEADPDLVKIRFAHWQLEGGVRDAFDQLAREYEALHPGVEIEQIAIPEKIAKNWARTQFVGGTAPDLIEIGDVMGTTPEILARYFVPLAEWIEMPNPYNAGTDLAATPWRETFIDGMSGRLTYSEPLLDYFGVPSSTYTIRMFYNRELWRRILGTDATPANYEDFIDVCRKAAEFKYPGGEGIIAIAGSKYNAPFVMNALFESQTQKLKPLLSPIQNLGASPLEVALAYLDGGWDWQTPAVQSGLELMMRSGKFMQPGFLSLGRDDALFYFAQERALMICTGSWDSSSLRIQVPFEIGVFKIPVPSPDDPKYGKYTLGQISEAGIETGVSFGITTASKHPDIALDFLRFLTSKASNAEFSRLSGWLPSVVGVEIGEAIKPFEPFTEGYVAGFRPDMMLGADTGRVVSNSLYRLVGPNGTVPEFVALMEEEFGQAVVSDLERRRKSTLRNVATKDSTVGAYHFLQSSDADDSHPEMKFITLLESQIQQETELYYLTYKMKQRDAGLK